MVLLVVKHSADKVLLGIGLAYIGAYGGLSLCEQYRLATLSPTQQKSQLVLLLVASALGWACTWCMHALSLSSMKILNGDEVVPVRFNASVVILAGIQSILQTYVGLYISSTDECFNKTSVDIMEKFIARASTTYTLNDLKKMNKMRILLIVLTHSLERLNIGGLFGGAGIAAMHYILLHSMVFQGRIEYNPGIVVASFLFAMFNGTGAFWAFFRLLSLFPSYDTLRPIIAAAGVLAVVGMHYIGMEAVTFHYDPDVRMPDPSDSANISVENLYTGAIASSVIFVVLALMFVLHDLRNWLYRTSVQLRLADKALAALLAKAKNSRNYPRPPSEVMHYSKKYMTESTRGATASTVDTSAGRTSGSFISFSSRQVHLYNDYVDDLEVRSVNSQENNSGRRNSTSADREAAFSPPTIERVGDSGDMGPVQEGEDLEAGIISVSERELKRQATIRSMLEPARIHPVPNEEDEDQE